MRKINKIFVHHSASSQKSTTRDMIHQWHLDRGWTGVGYHYVIQEQSLTVLLRGLLDEFNLDAGEIYGHMELGQTACPGQHLFKWVSDWRVGYAKAKRTT